MQVNLDIADKDVYDLLTSSLEGGSNYWYMIQKVVWPIGKTFRDPMWDKEREKDPKYVHQLEVPFNPMGALMIDDEMADHPTLKKPVRLDRSRIQEGLNKWANSQDMAHHWGTSSKGTPMLLQQTYSYSSVSSEK